MGNDGAKLIAEVIEDSQEIVSLDFSTNYLTPEGAHSLFKALLKNESIVDLNLSSSTKEGKYRNHIRSSGVQFLKPVLIHNKFLQILNLAGNSIKNEGVKAICEGIVEGDNKSLISLNLSLNELSHSICEELNLVLQ